MAEAFGLINEAAVNFILREFVMSNVYSNLPIQPYCEKR